MPTQVQFRRGTTAQNNNFTGASGEISINTSNNTIRVHDGSTVGGFELAKTGNLSSLASSTSAQLASLISDETGSGALVFATSPTLVTPALGTPSAIVLTSGTGLPLTTGVTGTLPVANGGTGITSLGSGVATLLGTPSSANLAAAITDETGSGALVFATSPTLVTPALGTPSAIVLTSGTGLPLTTGVTGTLPVANGGTGVTASTGTGSVVLSASPTFTGNILADSLTLSGNLIVSGTTTTINSTTLTVDDKNIELGSTASPSDATADGGGITLKGDTDKTFNYVHATTAWTSSEDLNLLTGKVFKINGTTVAGASGVTANTYGGAAKVPVFTVDTFGRITSAANVSVAGVSTFTASGNTFTIGTADGGSFSASIQADSVRLGTDTTGDYVASMTAGNGITVGTATGEGSTPVIANTGVLSVNGQTGNATGFATTANSLSQFASTTSAQLATLVSDETGSGALVFATSPTLVTPALGTPSAIVLTSGTGLPLSTGVTGTLPVANGGTGTASPATVAGTGISVSGSFPNQTITNTGVTSAVASTGISVSGATGAVTFTNTGVTSLVAGTNISVSGATGAVTVGVTGTVASATSATNSTNFAVTDDTTTNSTHYLTFVSGTSSNQAGKVSSTKLTFNPSTGLLTSTDYNSSSDKRLKKNIKTVENALDKVMALRGVAFDWKEGGAKSIGLVAQEAEVILPEIVTHDDNGYLGIKYTNLIGVLVEAIKEQQVQINTLKKQIEKL